LQLIVNHSHYPQHLKRHQAYQSATSASANDRDGVPCLMGDRVWCPVFMIRHLLLPSNFSRKVGGADPSSTEIAY